MRPLKLLSCVNDLNFTTVAINSKSWFFEATFSVKSIENVIVTVILNTNDLFMDMTVQVAGVT
jgi:hypothetical protein